MAVHESSTSSRGNSIPSLPPDSPGSSVSSRMQDEYDELLKYAVVVPTVDVATLPGLLHDTRGSFLQEFVNGQQPRPNVNTHQQQQQQSDGRGNQHTPRHGSEHDDDEESTTVEDEESSDQSNSDLNVARSTPSSTEIKNTKFYNAVHTREVDKFLSTQKFSAPLLSDTDSITELKKQQESEQDLFAEDHQSSVQGSEAGESPSHLSHSARDHEGFTPGVDPDIMRMDTLMEQWLGDLKRNVLAEFSHSRIRQMEGSRQNFQKEREKHAREMTSLQNELESMKELLHTYEQSIERKDDVITNLTRAMQKQKDKFDMLKTFCEWKIRHNDLKREGFASNLAAKHYERSLQQKAWDGWHSLIEARWRQRVEKACQAKAQEVCMQLTNDYESKITSLNEALTASRAEVARLHAERDQYEDTMKKAFMRGVCALNMEAMSMFHETDQDIATVEPAHYPHEGPGSTGHSVQFLGDPGAPVTADHLGAPVSLPQEPLYTTEPPGAPTPPRVVSGPSARPSQHSSGSSVKTSVRQKPTKTIKAKVTARTDSGRGSGGLPAGSTLAPPMSSVMVERHQPVTKQTIGRATAMKYPKSGVGVAQHTQSGIIQRKVAGQAGGVGQSGSVQLVNTNVQTVKVVE